MISEFNLTFLQKRIKFLNIIYRKNKENIKILDNIIYETSINIISNFNKQIINQYCYNKNLSKLENINSSFELLKENLKYSKIFKNLLEINKIKVEIFNIIKECGIKNIKNLLFILNEKIIDTDLLDFVDKYLNITSVDFKEKEAIKKIKFDENSKNKFINEDIINILKMGYFLFSNKSKKNLSFLESIYGCKLYIKSKKNNIFILSGYLNNDQFNLYRNHPILKIKMKMLEIASKN